MPPRTSLRAFLTTARKALASPTPQRPSPLTFVVGNESADLDSLCCALLFAYLRTCTPPHVLHIPIANLQRDDLVLRKEFTTVLQQAELQPEEVLTLTDLPSASRDGPSSNGDQGSDLRPEDTRWLLVDHNDLTGSLAKKYGNRAVGCIDHHVDEGKIPADTGMEPRVIEKSGSCASLVVNHMHSEWDALGKRVEESEGQEERKKLDTQLARLALAPILIDTANLKSTDKVTDHDVSAVQFLETKLAADGSYYRTQFFDQIAQSKEDLSGLTFRDIFRKDYKQWREGELTLGISSAVQGLRYQLGLAEGDDQVKTYLAELRKWGEESKLDVLGVMTTSHPKGRFVRELLLWGLSDSGVKVVKRFVEESSEKLKLETWEGGELDVKEGQTAGEGWRRAWVQGDLTSSRKQVGPKLRDAMRGV